MYASVTTGRIQAGKMDEFINFWRNSIKPFAQTFPGFVDVYVLTKTQTNGKFQEIVAMAAHLVILESLVRKGYDVSIHP